MCQKRLNEVPYDYANNCFRTKSLSETQSIFSGTFSISVISVGEEAITLITFVQIERTS
jgi:hypothetical protein